MLQLPEPALDLTFVLKTAVSPSHTLTDFAALPEGVVLLDGALLLAEGESVITAVAAHFPHAPLILLTDINDESVSAWSQLSAIADSLPRDQLTAPLLKRLLVYIQQTHTHTLLQNKAREHRHIAEALLQTSIQLNAILDYEVLLDSILERAAEFLPYDLATILLIQGDQVHIERVRAVNGAKALQWAVARAAHVTFTLHETRNLREMVENGRYMVIPNVDDYPDWIHLRGSARIRSWAGAPLIVQGDMIGFLTMDKADPNFYQEEKGPILEVFAKQAALALRNALVYQGRQREIAELSALHAIAQASTEAVTVDELLTRCTQIVAEKLYPDSFGFVLINPDGATISAHPAFHNRLPVLHPDKLPLGAGVVGQVIDTGVLRRVSDVRSDQEYKGIVVHTHSELCVPLQVGEKIIGAINAESILYDAFSEADERFMVALSQQLATGIERIQLLEAERKSRELADKLRDATAFLATSLELEQVFNNILNRLEEVVPHDSASVLLVYQDELLVAAARGFEGKPDPVGLAFPISDHLFAEVQQTKRPLCLTDAQQNPHFKNWNEQKNIHSWICLPLIVRDQVLGALTIDSERIGVYGPAETQLAQVFANQAAIAIENARLYEAEQRARQRAEILREASSMMIQTLDMGTILSTLLNYMGKLVPYDSASVLFVEGDFAQIYLSIGADNWVDVEALKQVRININTNQAFQEIMRTHRGMLIADVHKDNRWETFEQNRYIGSWIGVPLIAAGEFLGCFSVDKAIPGFFTEAHLDLIEGFTNQAAILIQNALLFQETQQRALELEIIAALSAALRETVDLETMLRIVMEKVLPLIHGAFGGIYLIEPETGDLVVRCTVPHMPEMMGLRRSVKEGISGYVARTGRVYIARDFATDPLLSLSAEEEPLMQKLRTGVNLPLRTQERVVGVLHVALDYEHIFSDREIQLLTAVSEIAGTAVDRAMVLDTLEQRVAQRTHELANANQRLTELDRLKTKFISDISHELRTPITNLSLYLDLLEQGLPERREQYTAVLHRQVNRLATMIEDILNISRLDMGKIKLNIAALDVNQVIEEVAADFQNQVDINVTLSTELHPDIPFILGDRKQIAQILTNLLNNAINYTPAGFIRVTTSWNDSQNRVCIEVKDSGVGIPPRELDHVVDRFYRASNVSQSTMPGTGLGLSLVKELVELHHGDLEIDSELNVGTTVTLSIPMTPLLSTA
ncbi:MAG: GAF domain-containing protein [Chloroflexota bacterium]